MHQIVSLAARVRGRSRQKRPTFSTHRIIKACFPRAIVTGRDLPGGMHGMTSLTPDGPIIVYHRALSSQQQRFAIAHEIGHLLMDRAALAHGSGVIRSKAIETRADRFAVELLVPLEALREHVRRWPSRGVERHFYLDHVDEIASFFGVPSEVIDVRIRELASLAKLAA